MPRVTRQQYRAIQESLRPFEKALIDFYELQWHLKHTVPSVEEVTEYLRKSRPNIRQTTINYALTRRPVIKALDQRGIPFRQHTQTELTDQQKAAALTIMNMMDARPIAQKLDELGILPATYYAWLNDPVFKNFLDAKAEQNKINIKPMAVAELTKKINAGDWNALKFWLEATGELNNNDMPQSEVLLRMIIEIIQRHVKDGAIIMAIAEDMMKVTMNRTMPAAAIAGEIVEDDEVMEARKQLGV